MWILHPLGAFSIVKSNYVSKDTLSVYAHDAECFCATCRAAEKYAVRARCEQDLKNLCELLELSADIIMETPNADYQFRIMVSSTLLVRLMGLLALDIDYTNFKNAVYERQGKSRHDLYLEIWTVLTDLDERNAVHASNPLRRLL